MHAWADQFLPTVGQPRPKCQTDPPPHPNFLPSSVLTNVRRAVIQGVHTGNRLQLWQSVHSTRHVHVRSVPHGYIHRAGTIRTLSRPDPKRDAIRNSELLPTKNPSILVTSRLDLQCSLRSPDRTRAGILRHCCAMKPVPVRTLGFIKVCFMFLLVVTSVSVFRPLISSLSSVCVSRRQGGKLFPRFPR